jgi:hypothetical protein
MLHVLHAFDIVIRDCLSFGHGEIYLFSIANAATSVMDVFPSGW